MVTIKDLDLKISDEIENQYKNLTNYVRSLKTEFEKLNSVGKLDSQQIKDYEDKIEKATKAVISFKDGLSDAGKQVVDFIDDQDLLTAATEKLTNAFGGSAQFANTFMGSLQNLIQGASQYSSVIASVASDTHRGMVKPLQDASLQVLSVIPKMGKLDEALQNLKDAQMVARSASVSFGEGIQTANDKAKDYPRILRESAAATGITSNKLNEMNKELRIVPGALDLTSKGFAGINALQGQTVAKTAALATTMKAFGMTTAQAAKEGADSFLQFGQTTEETIQQMGLMAAAADKSGINRVIAAPKIKEASSSLAIFGQKAGAATNIWTTFMKNLGDTLPINQVQNMIKGLVDGIVNMGVESRAFIGLMSGITSGQTALGGALELELALRPGADETTKSDGLQKHMKGLTDTLARFGGGQVITLEQAANNPQMEVQFQLQRQMLGKLTGITSQEQQNRVLEVLKGVQSGGMAAIEGTQALQEVYKEGQTIADQELSVLKRIEQILRVQMGDISDKQLEALDASFRSTEYEGLSLAVGREMNRPSNQAFSNTESAQTMGANAVNMLANVNDNMAINLGEFNGSLTESVRVFAQSAKDAATNQEMTLKQRTPRQPGDTEIQATVQQPRQPGDTEIQATIQNLKNSNILNSTNSLSNDFISLSTNINKTNESLKNFANIQPEPKTKEQYTNQLNENLQLIVDSLNNTKETEIFSQTPPPLQNQQTGSINSSLQARIENVKGNNNIKVDIIVNGIQNENINKLELENIAKNVGNSLNDSLGINN